MANGQLVPNEGATRLAGKSLEGGNMVVTAQVAAVTKPLAAANEIVDADNWIILHKKGGIIKKLSQEAQGMIQKIIEDEKGSSVPIAREDNQFIMEIIVPYGKGSNWETPKKTFKGDVAQVQAREFECQTCWEAFWDSEENSGFQRQA